MKAKILADSFIATYNQHIDEPESLNAATGLVLRKIMLYSKKVVDARNPKTNYDWSKILDECNDIWKAFVNRIDKANLQFQGVPVAFKPDGFIIYIQKTVPKMYLAWSIVHHEIDSKRSKK